MPSEDSATLRMQSLIDRWEPASDPKAVFLRCYQMMTSNMLVAIEKREFEDSAWVNRLLDRFADYYFVALEAYERDPSSAPAVWQLAHDAARDGGALPLQNLLLGVNAHINYDLVLALFDLLGPEWSALSAEQRVARHTDHCRVNDVIARTVDAVQDQVLERAMPVMDLVDRLLGPLDELLVSHLIAHWRDSVWHNATRLLESAVGGEQTPLLQQIEEDALRLGKLIALGDEPAPDP